MDNCCMVSLLHGPTTVQDREGMEEEKIIAVTELCSSTVQYCTMHYLSMIPWDVNPTSA